ncbi:hypothetical protein AVDCRST_MAG94-5188 [uncultured Leptolyngbya sp.]|uniref:Uncharacterized protein n=1 Tax=uncultured Leptolyngbya sp. TaxID=332963 RepID=A0A6J4NFI0_9CYAN|nr:hypothetical protein AVDCRST_MAG94-5188 [uncultured Leptolyngbya sp.]
MSFLLRGTTVVDKMRGVRVNMKVTNAGGVQPISQRTGSRNSECMERSP